jgi:tetratricopeptide (TPR) repeat protein
MLLQQRGLIFLRTGRDSDALNALSGAIALLDGDPAETVNLAAALLNLSFAHLNRGEVRQAQRDLTRCQQVTAGSGDEAGELHAAKALHNLGYCDLLAGDIPAALQLFTAAAATYQRIAPSYLPVLAMDKARTLLAVGLAGEAAGELDSAMAAFRQQRLDDDLAEAELARSEAALAAGQPAVSRRWATVARRRFLRHGNDASACVAELTRCVLGRSHRAARHPSRLRQSS